MKLRVPEARKLDAGVDVIKEPCNMGDPPGIEDSGSSEIGAF
jgi:hypothetical protein